MSSTVTLRRPGFAPLTLAAGRVASHGSLTSRATVRLTVADLSTPYAVNTLQGIADVATDRGTVRFHPGRYTLYRRNVPTVQAINFPLAAFDCAARVALSALAAL